MNDQQALFEESPDNVAHRAGGGAIVRWLVLVAVAFGVLAAGMAWISKTVTVASPISPPLGGLDPLAKAARGDSAYPTPDFRLASLDGGMVGPADFAGDVVLVEFWATWCAPCRLQAKYLELLHEELGGHGVRFLAIDSGEDEATVREYVERNPFPYPVLLDPEDALSSRYQLYGLPTVMVIDRQGAVSFLETGVSDTGRLRHVLREAGADIT